MSFDVFFQRFADGDARSGGGESMRAVLQPFVVREEPEHDFLLMEYKDGTADVYLRADGLMANHISGREPWDLLVSGARAAEWVILPVGCATCITSETQRVHLPAGHDVDVALVETGADLLQAIESSYSAPRGVTAARACPGEVMHSAALSRVPGRQRHERMATLSSHGPRSQRAMLRNVRPVTEADA